MVRQRTMKTWAKIRDAGSRKVAACLSGSAIVAFTTSFVTILGTITNREEATIMAVFIISLLIIAAISFFIVILDLKDVIFEDWTNMLPEYVHWAIFIGGIAGVYAIVKHLYDGIPKPTKPASD